MRDDDLILQMDDDGDLVLEMDGGDTFDLDLGDAMPSVMKNYERLTNKPRINGAELVGNKFLGDIFPDGILINCGDSTGYPAPVIPPGVPNAEGVGF